MKKGNKNVKKFIKNYLTKNFNRLLLENIEFEINYVSYDNGQVNYYIDYEISKNILTKDNKNENSIKKQKGRILFLKFDPENKNTYEDLNEIIKHIEKKYLDFLNEKEEEYVDKKQYVEDKKINILSDFKSILDSLEGTLSYFKSSNHHEMDLLLEDLYENFIDIDKSFNHMSNKINEMCKILK